MNENETPQLPEASLYQIAEDLNATFEIGQQQQLPNNRVFVKHRSNLTTENIERVIAFTWFDMYSDAETKSSNQVC